MDFKDFAEKSGKTEDQVKSYWEKCKQISIETFGKEDYKFQIGALKNMLNLKENKYIEFLKSDKDARGFIKESVKEDAQVSTSLGNISSSPDPIKKSDNLEIVENKDGDVHPEIDANISYRKKDRDKVEEGDLDYKKGYEDRKNNKPEKEYKRGGKRDSDYMRGYEDAERDLEENVGGGDDGSSVPFKKDDTKAVTKA